jgi:hypothetical protein
VIINEVSRNPGAVQWFQFMRKRQPVRTEYPNVRGTVKLSAVAFDRSGTQALAFRAWDCEGPCGNGGFHLLRLDPRWGWQIRGSFGGWVQ